MSHRRRASLALLPIWAAGLLAAGCAGAPLVAGDVESGADAGRDVRADDGQAADAGDATEAGDAGAEESASDGDSGAPAPDADAGSSAPDRFELPAATGSYDVDFGIGIDGLGSSRVGSVAVTGGAGTITIDGTPRPVGIYEKQAWDAFGYNLYQVLAVAPDRWFMLWLYCRGGALTDIYIEDTAGGDMAWEPASGTCDESSSASTVSVSFPAVDLPVPDLVGGFTIAGTDLELDGAAPGWVRAGSSVLSVYVFDHVDCSQECGTPGWYELHALLWDPERQWLCFGIFYLFTDAEPVLLTYAFSLPSLQAPFGAVQFPDATWSGP
jgi:hypothetical protein